MVLTIVAVLTFVAGIYGIVMAFVKNDMQELACLVAFIPTVLVISFRKYLFSKFVVDEQGVAFLYRKKEIKRILWKELTALTIRGSVVFVKQEKVRIKIGYPCNDAQQEDIRKLCKVIGEYRSKFPQAQIDATGQYLEWLGQGF
jgi:flagellar biosynthesis protein FliQ